MRARAWQWVGLVAGLLGFALFWLDEFLKGPLSRADPAAYALVGRWQDHGFPANAVGDAVSTPVSVPWAVGLTAITVVAWWLLRDRRMALWAGAGGLVAGAAIYGLKQTIQRPLPPHAAGAWYKFSFPSGHTISAVANVGVLILLMAQVFVDRWGLEGKRARRCWMWAIAAWCAEAVLMGFARILTQRHWAGDVYASWAVGLALACGLLLLAGVPRPPHLHPKARRRHADAERQTGGSEA
jgi:membrane-associated phospholipid phosphatase